MSDASSTGDTFNMSGNFQGAIINIKAQLQNVTLTVGHIPNADQSDKEELKQLIEQLSKALEDTPLDHTEHAEEVSKRVESFVKTMNEDKPDKEDIDYAGKRLMKAAENIKNVLPTVFAIATQIVVFGAKFAV